MNNQDKPFTHRKYTRYTKEIPSGENLLFKLDYLSVITLYGDKSADFLQGQLSCDIRQINENTMRQGAICNLKGRVLALPDVIKWQNYQLVLPADLLENTLVSLTKTAMLSRVSLKKAVDLEVYGLYLHPGKQSLPETALPETEFSVTMADDYCCYSTGDNYFLLIAKSGKARQFEHAFTLCGSEDWHKLQLARKRVEIYPETRGMFLPHRLDLHLSGYLNFEKGCYKGQEIIARMHYRSKPKHSLQIFTINTDENLIAGKKLFNIATKAEVGELIDFAPCGKENFLIAVSILFEYPTEVLLEGYLQAVELIPV